MESRDDFEIRTRIIDPTRLSPKENRLLSFILTRSQAKFFLKDINYFITARLPEELDVDFFDLRCYRLTHTIIRRPRERDSNEYRFEVYGNELGHGTYGSVNQIIGTLVLNHDMTLFFKTDTQRVAKNSIVVFNSPDEFVKQKTIIKDLANQEWKMLKLDNSFGVKEPVFFDKVLVDHQKEFVSVLVMKFIEGENLNDIILQVKNIKTDNRIKICIALLRGMQWVHELKIRHGDIKPANILVKLNSSFYTAKVIDWMGCQPMEEKSNDDIHTSVYAPLEVIKTKKTSKESDYYSGAICLFLILGGSPHPVYALYDEYTEIEKQKEKLAALFCKNNDDKECKRIRKLRDSLNKRQIKIQRKLHKKLQNPGKYYDLTTLFTGIDDLEKTHRSAIKHLLTQMMSIGPDKRCSFAQALQLFEKIDLERKIEAAKLKITNENFQITAYHHAHSLGIHLRNELDMLRIKNIDEDGLLNIKKLLEKYLRDVTDTQDIIKLFVERLQVQAFARFTFKHDILNTFGQAVEYFKESFVKFNKVNDDIFYLIKDVDEKKTWLDSSGIDTVWIYERLKNLEKEMMFLFKKHEKRCLSIDNLFLVINKFKKIDNLASQLDECREQFQLALKEYEAIHAKVSRTASLSKKVRNFKIRIFDVAPPPDLKNTSPTHVKNVFKGNK